MMNTNLPTILYGDYDIFSANYSEERIEEARRIISMAIDKAIEENKKIAVGCSCGKDSTVLLQLTLEVMKQRSFSADNLIITHNRTTYETTAGTRHANEYIETSEKNGYHIRVLETPLHARYAVRTVGVGTLSGAGARC